MRSRFAASAVLNLLLSTQISAQGAADPSSLPKIVSEHAQEIISTPESTACEQAVRATMIHHLPIPI
jgi:hypothetical protein